MPRTPSLVASLLLIGFCLAPLGAAKAALISFVEDPAELAPIAVTTDLAGGSTTSTLGAASLSIGDVTGQGSFLLNIALIQPGTQHQTGGGKGVSDILQLLSFTSNGTIVGFEAIYLSDQGKQGLLNPGFPNHPTYCSTIPGDGTPCGPGLPNSEFIKTGALLSFFESVTLPGTASPTDLEVEVQSPLQDVTEPPGLALLVPGLVAFAMASRRKRRVSEWHRSDTGPRME